jgi:predicted nucleic acid-binding protein
MVARGAATMLHVAEPSAAYARRPRIIADATVLAAIVFGEQQQAEAVALLRGRTLSAPHLVDFEMTSVGLKKVQRERLPQGAVLESLQAYAALSVERYSVDPPAVLALAQRYKLTAYDAAYLWVAERLEAPLVTFDALLARAAQQHLAGDTRSGDPA